MNEKTFFNARIKSISSKLDLITSILTHHGEAGHNLELVVKELLEEYIPNKFGVESGFVQSLEDPDWQSNQIDLLFTRKDIGHPLAVLPASKVFPIESILGFMEITKNINRDKLIEDFEKVESLKKKRKRTYTIPYLFAKSIGIKIEDEPPKEKERFIRVQFDINDLEPRFFYFAFSTDWENVDTICKNIKEIGIKYCVHLHGIFINGKGFFCHKPSNPATFDVLFETKMPDAFIIFIHTIIESLQSFTDIPFNASIPLDKYGSITNRLNEYTGS